VKESPATLNPDWRDGFLFLANQPALDFLNTRPVQDGNATELLPDFEARQRWDDPARTRRTLEAARELRERLRSEVLTWEAGIPVHRSTVDELNRLMAGHPMRTRLKALPKGLTRELWFETAQPEDLLAPLAHAAAALFAEISRDRVRKCGQCVLHFHDTSKKGTRRWCSMRLCGNRMKVAAYAARQRTP
jgi:predicted RNA-binding Zn ribbon-like protein